MSLTNRITVELTLGRLLTMRELATRCGYARTNDLWPTLSQMRLRTRSVIEVELAGVKHYALRALYTALQAEWPAAIFKRTRPTGGKARTKSLVTKPINSQGITMPATKKPMKRGTTTTAKKRGGMHQQQQTNKRGQQQTATGKRGTTTTAKRKPGRPATAK